MNFRHLRGKRVALIGGAGFIGHNLAIALHHRGAIVHVIDGLVVNNLLSFSGMFEDQSLRSLYLHMIHERIELLHEHGIQLHIQDARNYHELSGVMNEIKPDVVVQLAAVAHANKSNKNPYATFDHSLRTLENALDWSRTGNVEQFVYFSSSMVYGNFKTPVVSEDHVLDPLGIYGALKLSGEKIVISYKQVFDVNYTIIRPSALYGPRCVSRRVGQIFIENAFRNLPMKVMGKGEDRIDFTYIDDLIDGLSLVIGNKKAHNEVFNLTYGDARTLNDLAKIIQGEFPDAEIEYMERDRLIPFRGTLSIDKARDILGYNPKTSIEIGMPKYVSWYRTIPEFNDGRKPTERQKKALRGKLKFSGAASYFVA